MRRLLSALMLGALPAQAQDIAGEFDYYVLSLSWSPSWCALEGDARQSPQCDASEDFGWILHGLWPQYERGYPADCQTAMRPPSRSDTAAMADIMGTSGLAWHQWRKHGVCTGLTSDDYYTLSRDAYSRITRPAVLRNLDREVTLPASLIEEAFLRDNHLFAAVNDKVAPLIVNAFAQITQIGVIFITQYAKQTPEHNGHVAQKFLLGHFGSQGFPEVDTGILGIRSFGHLVLTQIDIDVEGSRVREIAETRFVGKHIRNRPVLFDRRWFA